MTTHQVRRQLFPALLAAGPHWVNPHQWGESTNVEWHFQRDLLKKSPLRLESFVFCLSQECKCEFWNSSSRVSPCSDLVSEAMYSGRQKREKKPLCEDSLEPPRPGQSASGSLCIRGVLNLPSMFKLRCCFSVISRTSWWKRPTL